MNHREPVAIMGLLLFRISAYWSGIRPLRYLPWITFFQPVLVSGKNCLEFALCLFLIFSSGVVWAETAPPESTLIPFALTPSALLWFVLLVLLLVTGIWGWRQYRSSTQNALAWQQEQQRRRLSAYTTGVGYWEWHIPSSRIEVDARCASLIGKTDGAGALYLDPQQSHKEEPPWRPLFESVREDLDSGEVISERHIKFDGCECWLLLKGGLLDSTGEMAFGTVLDVSSLHGYQEKLIKLRITDALTGLLNRRYFFDRLAQSCAQCRRDRRMLSVALVDIAGFREINSKRGYSAGDCALQQLSGMLQNHCRPYDLLGRFADHTLVLMFQDLEKTQVMRILQRFQERLRTTQILAGSERFYCTLNCAVADSTELPRHTLCASELLSRVEQRLQHARRQGNSIISSDEAA